MKDITIQKAVKCANKEKPYRADTSEVRKGSKVIKQDKTRQLKKKH